MFKLFCCVLLTIFTVLGVCDFLHGIWMLILRPPTRLKKTLLCQLNSECDFLALNYIVERQRWHGSDFADRIIAVSEYDISDELMNEFENKGITFIKQEEISADFNIMGVFNE